MKRLHQTASTHPQQPQGDQHVTSSGRKYLTETEAARYCNYFERGLTDPVGSFQKWARRHGIPVKVAGRSRNYAPAMLDRFMDREAWTVRHATKVPRPRLVRTRKPVAPQANCGGR